MTATTIKLDSQTRDRLNAAAREEGLTAGSMVERLLELRFREQRLADLAAAIASTSDDDRRSWQAETDEWERTDLERR